MKFCRENKRVVPDDATVCPFHKTDRCLAQFGGGGKPGDRESASSRSTRGDDPALRSELLALEGQIHAGKRRSTALVMGTACALALGLATWFVYHVNSVWNYASLDADVRITRDPSDPTRVAVFYLPLSDGAVGFTRSDAGRETELLDRVSSATGGDERKLEWRWSGVQEGDVLRATYRKGWSVATQELHVPAAPKPPPLGTSVVSGRVVDATKNKPLPGAQVQIAGTNLTSSTNDNGEFRLTGSPEGPVGIKISATGFSTNEIEKELIPGTENRLDVVALSPGMAKGQIRVVLTWHEEPMDLDAHLEGPLPNGKRFHVFFGDLGDLQSQEYVNLDTDRRTGGLAETITVLGVLPGRYHYFVHDFTNIMNTGSTALARSGATVEVYQGGQMLRRFATDQKSAGNIWHVCDIEVTADQKAVVHKLDVYEGKLLELKVTRTLVLAVENSDRFTARNLEILKKKASNILGNLPLAAGWTAGVVCFGPQGVVVHEPCADKQGLQSALAAIGPASQASLAKALENAHRMLKASRGGRLLVVLTAGIPRDEKDVQFWIDELRKSGINVAAFGTADVDLTYLRKLASVPGDAFLIPDEP